MNTDPYLTLPLDGLRLIEASAGTGKTFTLATLFTRLVIEQHLTLPQILAVTFTEAATQELRARIRERLALAAQVTACPAQDSDHPETLLTRSIIQQHLAHSGESAAQLAARLRRAVEDADLASIFTIHSFCAKALREHALDSGESLIQHALVTNPKDLYAELAADLWRIYSREPDDSKILTRLWKDQTALAGDIAVLASDLPLKPEIPQTLVPNPHFILEAATGQLTQSIIEHEQHARHIIADACANKTISARYKPSSFDKAFIELNAGVALGEWPRGDKYHIDKLATGRLEKLCNQGRTPPSSPLFDALQLWFDADDLIQQWLNQQKILLLHRLRDEIKQRFAQTKQQRQIQTYDDLIGHLANALRGEHADILAERLRTQYKFALVDEFQDTDPRQWEIFRSIFIDGLFLIGDPKQAIYGFRGGDIHTYLNAKSSAIPAPPLNRNFRSRPSVLRAIETLYKNAGKAAFGSADIGFIQILPGGQCNDEDYLLDGQPAPALTICQIESDGPPMNAEPARTTITAACVADIHRVLFAARQGRAQIGGKPVEPGDIAVLVRNHKEATRIRQALAGTGIPAVAAGKQSIFATAEAHDIRLLLLALLHPSDPGRLRAALATVLLGEDAAAIAALESDPGHRHHQRLLHWRQSWQRSGIFAMLAGICADHAQRLLTLSDGERRLTNTLQLAELLQQESARQPGPHGLLDWLSTRIIYADDNDEAQQLRLESDAHCVQIVTLHKSKGLEYPLVYLPFVGMETTSSHRVHRIIHDGDQRTLYWKIDPEDEDWASAVKQSAQDTGNETARLLYVGLTRAKHALWTAAGHWKGWENSPLAGMLQNQDALRATSGILVTRANSECPARLPPAPAPAPPPPRTIQRRIHADWWIYSFTQLAHTQADDDPVEGAIGAQPGGAEDELDV